MAKQTKKTTAKASAKKTTRVSNAKSATAPRKSARAASTNTKATPTARGATAVAERTNTASAEPTLEQIRQRAYEIFLARAGRPGCSEGDWAQAEWELRAEAGLS